MCCSASIRLVSTITDVCCRRRGGVCGSQRRGGRLGASVGATQDLGIPAEGHGAHHVDGRVPHQGISGQEDHREHDLCRLCGRQERRLPGNHD